MTVDVTWSPEKLKQVAANAIEVYGRIDYLINNAGYVCQGAIEEVSCQETYDIFNTNVFGVLNVTRSFLPHFRQRRSGGIIIISSITSRWYHPGMTIYSATKAAVSTLGEGLKAEVEGLGIKVLTIDLGHFRTPVLERDTNLKRAAQVIMDYKPINGYLEEYIERRAGNEPNDPKLGVLRVIEIITQSGMATGREVPARILLGADGKEPFVKICQDIVKQIEEWSDVICSTSY
ncbi:short chain dehydrogenase [Rhizoctonia solani]|uniref:Short chain dehydrogenase n=1 Tax=Rhizoctonia solani TaxID=456999 RepID=A0A8H8SYA7_9AGAM|nr:short chain dehydrogenase [Rhizoctonia solani]QRW22991.1 short chain dehydrogenase [Rhizoctonia solani]